MFKRMTIFLYGVVSYAVFFGYIPVCAGLRRQLRRAAHARFHRPRAASGASLLVDLGLLGLFAVQHSVMARPFFKRWLTRIVPESAERSTYVLASSLALIVMFACWQPLGGVVWYGRGSDDRAACSGARFAFGWLLVLVSTFLINHFDLFGLRQVWLQLVGRPYSELGFRTPGPYKYVRHPLYVGWLFAFWAAPTMTVSHLVFAIATTGYILIAIQFEERDLMAHLGQAYREYRERVPSLDPVHPQPL